MANKSEVAGGLGDTQINSKYQSLLSDQKKTMNSNGEDVKEIPHNAPTNGQNPTGPMKGHLMNWTEMLEAMDTVQNALVAQSAENDITNDTLSDEPIDANHDDILEELNRLFTPILVMQGLESEISDKVNSEMSESGEFTERSMISFDEPARMAQLIATCALLIAKKKNTEEWQMYKKAAAIKTQSKLNIQKQEYNEAQALAQKYLVKVSTTNNSSVARDAANDLLPQTQH